MTAPRRRSPDFPGPGIRSRHVSAAIVAGFAAGIIVLVLSSLNSVAGGFGALGPYQGIGELLGFSGGTAIGIGIAVDIVIPIVAAFVMVATLALLSRTRFFLLEFRTHLRALAEGGMIGLVIWAVFYVPVISHLSNHPTLSSLLSTLLFGLFEHVVFGAVIGIILFLLGGPVMFGPRAPTRPDVSVAGEPHERREN
jgi:hypothetical protein